MTGGTRSLDRRLLALNLQFPVRRADLESERRNLPAA